MNKFFIIIILSIFLCKFSFANNYRSYYYITYIAQAYYYLGDYEKALQLFDSAFSQTTPQAFELAFAIKTAINENDTIKIEQYVHTFYKMGYQKHIIFELISDSKWKNFADSISIQYKDEPFKFNNKIYYEIKVLVEKDQKYRMEMEDHIYSEKQKDSLWKLQLEFDAQNLDKIKLIMDECNCWPGPTVIGNDDASILLFHTPVQFRNDNIEFLIEQINKGNICPNDVAAIQDQVLVYSGKKQKYGTYSNKGGANIFPIQDTINIDCIRDEIGLPPLEYHRGYIRYNKKKFNYKFNYPTEDVIKEFNTEDVN